MIGFWFYTLLKVSTEKIKYGKYHLLLINKSHYILILLKSLKGQEIISSLEIRAGNGWKIFVVSQTIV